MTLVLNATSLIYLAKASRLDLLQSRGEELLIPSSVHREVVEVGEARGHPDAGRVRALVDSEMARTVDAPDTKLGKRLEPNDRLHVGERDVLVLASTHDATAVLDDRYARRIAEAEGIRHGGTVFLLLSSIDRGIIDADDARRILDSIVERGWHCSTDLYAKILHKLEQMD